jgi:molecular chaperone GrpE
MNEEIKKQDEIVDDINAGEDLGIEESEKEKQEFNEKYLRLNADFDNFRKRMQKEKIDLIKYANEDIIIDFLNVIDNFDRAIDGAEKAEDMKTVIEGIKMVQKQFHDTLEKRGLSLVNCIGEDFDPHLHEAMLHEETDEVKEGQILEELQKGYKLNDKVIRYPKVKVAKAKTNKK